MTRPHRFLSTSSPTAVAESPEELSAESDFIFIIAALLCALVCFVGLITVAHCAWLRRRRSMANPTSDQPSAANTGVKKKVVDGLPKFAYDSAKEDKGGKHSSGDCVICLVDYADGDEIRVLPQCGHGFHVGCIGKWLGSHSTCPSCRQILVNCKKCGEIPTVAAGKSSLAAEEGGEHNGSMVSAVGR
ncbi:hypothetical protein SSX86_032561 [Deinandra increscens subsp. villosa]|uniref:RING-type E3 ubiquitin transferase n=1 Tax=Deinandra increscens subsp. villosa TaxID=3103831 RepID=A0AAP0C3I0_9ASTR